MNLPNVSPNFIHIIFRGVSNFELRIPRIKKIKEAEIDKILGASPFRTGHNPINNKTIKKTIPKLLLEEIFSIKYFITLLPKNFQT